MCEYSQSQLYKYKQYSQVGIHFSIRQSGFSIRGIVTSPPTPPLHCVATSLAKPYMKCPVLHVKRGGFPATETSGKVPLSHLKIIWIAPFQYLVGFMQHLKAYETRWFCIWRSKTSSAITGCRKNGKSVRCSYQYQLHAGMVWIYLLSKILPPLRPTPGALLRPSGASMRFSRTEQLQILKMWRQGGKAVQYTLWCKDTSWPWIVQDFGSFHCRDRLFSPNTRRGF